MLDSRFLQLKLIYTWRMSTAFVFCTIFAALLIWVVLLVENQIAENLFRVKAEAAYSKLLQKLNDNKTVISALSGWQHSQNREQTSELRIFSKEILSNYPHISSIQYIKKIPRKDREAFEHKMQEDGYATFGITQKNQKGLIETRPEKDNYFPTTFIEPLEPHTARILGFDMLSDQIVAQSIKIAMESGKETITPPVDILGGGKGLIVFKATYKGKVVPTDKKSRIDQINGLFAVSIVANDIKPFVVSAFSSGTTNIVLQHNEIDDRSGELLSHIVDKRTDGFADLFPSFNIMIDLSHAGQPVTLHVWRKANFSDYNFKVPIGIFLLYLTILFLIRLSLKGDLKHGVASEVAQDEIFKEKELAEVTLHSIADGVVTADINNNIDYMNEVAEELTGWQKNEAEGKLLNDIVILCNEHNPNDINNIFSRENIKNDIGELTENYLLKRNDETQYSVKLSASRIRNRSGDIVGTIIVFRNVTSERKMAQLMAYQARHDELTGLYNRREFEYQLKRSLEKCERGGDSDVLCYLDLDQFKVVNDTCGHSAGDKLLIQVTHILRINIRESDILARLGGDEFGLIIKSCSIEKSVEISTVLHNAIKEFHFSWEGKVFSIGSSMGLVKVSPEIGSAAEVMSAADSACYVAKDKGRNRIYAHTMNDHELLVRHGEMQWVHKINEAFENKRFRLYRQIVQPLLDASNPVHYEVLIRMEDEHGVIVPPMAFIPAAERYNVMPAIDRWVIETSFSMMKQENNQQLIYNINLSGKSINEDGFLEFIIEQIKSYEIYTPNICFEITETAAISNLASATEFMKTLKSQGCTFALDDFGSGLSSFTYLKNLPVDYLKVDGSFVKDLMDDAIDRAMVSSIAQVGRVMGIKTIAEFVENNAIKQQLSIMDIDYVQGFGIGEPEEWVIVKSIDSIKTKCDRNRLFKQG